MKYVYRIWRYINAVDAEEVAFFLNFSTAFSFIRAQGEITNFSEEGENDFYWERKFYDKQYYSEEEWKEKMSPKNIVRKNRRYFAGSNYYRIEKIKLEG